MLYLFLCFCKKKVDNDNQWLYNVIKKDDNQWLLISIK
jgi:hypothetical protein